MLWSSFFLILKKIFDFLFDFWWQYLSWLECFVYNVCVKKSSEKYHSVRDVVLFSFSSAELTILSPTGCLVNNSDHGIFSPPRSRRNSRIVSIPKIAYRYLGGCSLSFWISLFVCLQSKRVGGLPYELMSS